MAATGETSRPGRFDGSTWRWGIVKLAVSVTLLALILRRFSWPELRAQFASTSLAGLAIPFAIILLCNLLGAVQWKWILHATGIVMGFGRILRAYGAGLFLNNFMLGSVGGDVYKIYSVGRGAGDVGRVAGATIVDRVVGMSALCTLASLAAVWEIPHDRVPPGQGALVLGFGLFFLVTAAVLLHPGSGEALARRVARLPLGSWSDRLARLLGHLGDFRSHGRVLNRAFLLSLFIQGARVVAHFSVGQAMGWSMQASDLAKFFIVIPILGLVISLPISFGGWGVREWAGVALFAPLGHGGEEAVTLLALTATLSFIASLAGALALLTPAGRTAA